MNKLQAGSQSIRIAALVAVVVLSACSERADRAPTAAAPAAQQTAATEQQAKPALAPEARFAASTETLEGLMAMQTTGVCSLENVVTIDANESSPGDKPNSYKVDRGQNYRIVGFATNKDRGVVPADIEIVLAGMRTYSIRLSTGRPREDVADFFDNPSFANAGYLHDADFAGVEPGEYAVFVLEHHADAKAACSTNQSVRVI